MSLPSEQNWLIVFNLLTDLNKKGYDIPKGISPELVYQIFNKLI